MLRARLFRAGARFRVARGVAEGTVVVTTTGTFDVTTFGVAGPARLVRANTKTTTATATAAPPRTIAGNLIRASEPVAASRLDTNCRSAERQPSSNAALGTFVSGFTVLE
jgi:hypothetical protein